MSGSRQPKKHMGKRGLPKCHVTLVALFGTISSHFELCIAKKQLVIWKIKNVMGGSVPISPNQMTHGDKSKIGQKSVIYYLNDNMSRR